MKKWKTALLCGGLFAVPVLYLLIRVPAFLKSLQVLRAASSGGEASGNALLVDPWIVAAILAVIALVLCLVICLAWRGAEKHRSRRRI